MAQIAENLTREQIEIMDHTVSGHDRNWFATTSGCKDSQIFEELINLGFAKKSKAPSWVGSDVLYRLTDEGKQILQTVKRPWVKEYKISPGQRRYMAYQDSGTHEKFIDWLKNHDWDEYRKNWTGI